MKMIVECPENRLEPEIAALGLCGGRTMLEYVSSITVLRRYQPGIDTVWGPGDVQGPRPQVVDETSSKHRGPSATQDAQEHLFAQWSYKEAFSGLLLWANHPYNCVN